MLEDLRYAGRMARRSPGFVLTAIVTLALGIGANTAIFSIVETALLRPLPYRNAARLCVLWKSVPAKAMTDWTSYPVIADWRNQNHTFEDVAFALRPEGSLVTLTGEPEPERIQASKVSSNFFSVLGAAPALGRSFSEAETTRGENVAVLSRGFWERRYGASRDAIGRTIEIDRRSVIIIGVMPSGFQFPDSRAEIWLPIEADSRWPRFQTVRLADAFLAIGRLKDGASIGQARTDLTNISGRLAQQYPATDKGLDVRVVPLSEHVAGPAIRRSLWLLLGAVLSVLLIACLNIANLMLARGAARGHELAVRAAVGAGRVRLTRQLLTESVSISLAGGALGLMFASAALHAIVAFAPADVPRLDDVRIDGGVFAFAALLSLLAGLLSGCAPAWRMAQRDPLEALRGGGRGSSGALGGNRIQGLLVAAEFAFAVALLTGAGLLAHSFLRVQAVEPGFDPHRLFMATVSLPYPYSDRARWQSVASQTIEGIAGLPGVAGAAVGGVFSDHSPNASIEIEGRPVALDGEQYSGTSVSDGYFSVMRIPLLAGRLFSTEDGPNTAPVVTINLTMARRFWPNENPLGKRFRLSIPGLKQNWMTIVGVVGDVLRNGRESGVVPMCYTPVRQSAGGELNLVIRSAGDPPMLAPAIRRVVRSLEPAAPRFEVIAVERRMEELGATRRFETGLLALFAAAALFLAAIGVYSLMHYAVAQRTREIGIRAALGAQVADIVGLVVRQALSWVSLGVLAGIGGAFAISRALTSLLFGIPPYDPWTFFGVTGLLILTAALASVLPARRASRVDPLTALRDEKC